MAGERVELSSHPWNNGTSTSAELLDVVHFHYAWVLFIVFLASFVTNTVLTAEPSAESKERILTGPGGKPLPRSARKYKEELQRKKKLTDFSPSRKNLFLCLSAGVLATFIANGANIVIHALTKREEGWWCGQATAVSCIQTKPCQIASANHTVNADIRLRFCLLLQHIPHLPG